MYNEIEKAEMLLSFYHQMCHMAEGRLNDGSFTQYKPGMDTSEAYLVQYFDSRPVFRYREKSFIFGKDKKAPRLEYFNAQIKGTDRKLLKRDARVELYEQLFPFITFIRNEEKLARSGWYESAQLLDFMPTRRKFINDALEDLHENAD